MSQPIPFRTIRYRCPHCPRTGAVKSRIAEHIGRCWSNPAARGCKTCKHFEQDLGEVDVGLAGGEYCSAGVSLTGRPECFACGGHGWKGISAGAEVPCNAEVTTVHVGDGKAVKAGPIVGCHAWEECVRYFCPASGATECCGTHGGWDTCCDKPELHRPPDG